MFVKLRVKTIARKVILLSTAVDRSNVVNNSTSYILFTTTTRKFCGKLILFITNLRHFYFHLHCTTLCLTKKQKQTPGPYK